MDSFIKLYDGVFSDEFCDGVIELFENSPYKGEGTTGGGVDKTKKDSTDLLPSLHSEYTPLVEAMMPHIQKCFFDYVDTYHHIVLSMFDLTIKDINDRVVRVNEETYNSIPKDNRENLVKALFDILPPQIQKYNKGIGNYSYWHSETFPQLPNNESLHRMLLYIVYLNDVEEGGETEFYYQDLKVKPKRGSLVIAPCYFTHTHRGNIPISNDKYIMTSWLSFKDAKHLFC
jgi:hypothetical protein